MCLAISLPVSAQHSDITPDGSPSDWCFSSMLPLSGPDSRTYLNCPGPAPSGLEVVWEDSVGDLIFGPIDMTYLAVAGSSTMMYIVAGFTENPYPDNNLQIAIDVSPNGNQTWYNPDAASAPTLGTAVGIAPDYLITISGLLKTAILWEATTAPGSWTAVGSPFAVGFGDFDIEIALPWGSFGPGACSGCPPLELTSKPLITAIAAADSGAFGGTPGAPLPGIGAPFPFDISDLISESVSSTYTTSPNDCSAPGTTCEWADGSTDAFFLSPFLVIYTAPCLFDLWATVQTSPCTGLPSYTVIDFISVMRGECGCSE